MSYLLDLKKVININSFTNNKHGVDQVGQIFDQWLGELGFDVTIYKRELIGEHRL